jgi:hypothetical protein
VSGRGIPFLTVLKRDIGTPEDPIEDMPKTRRKSTRSKPIWSYASTRDTWHTQDEQMREGDQATLRRGFV